LWYGDSLGEICHGRKRIDPFGGAKGRSELALSEAEGVNPEQATKFMLANQRVDFSYLRSYNSYMEGNPMETVGIKELKNKLTYYLKLTKEGSKIIVTDRGSPVAIIQSIDRMRNKTGIEERLASLAKRGMLRLPLKKGKLPPFKSVKAAGKPASEIIIEERR